MRRILALTVFFALFAIATKIAAQQTFGSADINVSNQVTPNSLLAGKIQSAGEVPPV